MGFVDDVFARFGGQPSTSSTTTTTTTTVPVPVPSTPTAALPIPAVTPAQSTENSSPVKDGKAASQTGSKRKRNQGEATGQRQDSHYNTGPTSKVARSRHLSNPRRMTRRPAPPHQQRPHVTASNGMPNLFTNGVLPPTAPAFPGLDQTNTMAAYAFMQTMFPQMAAMLPAMPNGQGSGSGTKPRCQDYDNQGYCVLGSSCPFEHGDDRIVAPRADEYDPTRANFTIHERSQRAKGSTAPRTRGSRAPGQIGSRHAPRHTGDDQATIFVEYIPPERCQEDAVREFFSQYGNVLQVEVNHRRRTALVKYGDHAAAKTAFESPKVVFDNRFVRVRWFRPDMAHHFGHAQPVTPPSGTALTDDGQFQRHQEEKQRAYEERSKTRQAMDDAKKDIRSRRERMTKEREELMRKLAAAEGHHLSESSESSARPASTAGLGKDGTDPKIQALRDQLAQMQAEAKSLGIDHPDTPSHTSDHRAGSLSHGRSSGPPGRRGGGGGGGYSFRGRGGHWIGSRAIAPGFVRGRDPSVRKIDHRPKNIAVSGVDFDADGTKEESLRSYLTLIGPFVNLEVNPQRSDSRVIIFEERWQAEQVMRGGQEIPGLGQVELTWVARPGEPTDKSSTATTGVSRANGWTSESAPANGVEDILASLHQQPETSPSKEGAQQQQQQQQQAATALQEEEEDEGVAVNLDVAGGDDDDWGQIS